MKQSKRDKRNKNADDAFKMVRCINDGKNVDAYKLLEKIVKNKLSKKIDDAIADA